MAFKFPNLFNRKVDKPMPAKKKISTPLMGKMPVGKQLQMLSVALLAFLATAVAAGQSLREIEQSTHELAMELSSSVSGCKV